MESRCWGSVRREYAKILLCTKTLANFAIADLAFQAGSCLADRRQLSCGVSVRLCPDLQKRLAKPFLPEPAGPIIGHRMVSGLDEWQ